MFARICDALAKEPIAVRTVVLAGIALGRAVQTGHVTLGVISTVLLALAGLDARAQVTPTSTVDASTDGEVDPAPM